MNNPAIDLQAAIYSRLSKCASLLSELGANRIYDEAPARAEPPYVLFTKTLCRDWSTDTEEGAILQLTLETWSPRNGRKQVLVVDQLIKDALKDMAGPLKGLGPDAPATYELIRFSWLKSETDIIVRENRFRCRTTFEAVMEPVQTA